MDISAKITGIKYTPFLCSKLILFHVDHLDEALFKKGSFILSIDEKRQIALSRWTSAKRSRTYPYGRVYDCLNFQGKKATIIPFYKDEGKVGDRDYLQWDTISLMSLLGIYVIISYYIDAELSPRDEKKIANQKFNIEHVKSEIESLLWYQSDALHWNLSQIDKVGEIGQKAIEAYAKLSKKLGIEMHSENFAKKRIQKLLEGKEEFMNLSRELAQKAQNRESVTIQPKEKLTGKKATLTIKNYLGGYYYFTCDEVEIEEQNIYLIEGKNTEKDELPSFSDIKDGLAKMILFTNMEDVEIDNKIYNPVPILKFTTGSGFRIEQLKKRQRKRLELLKIEAQTNNFRVMINQDFL